MSYKMKGKSYVDFDERPVKFRNDLRTSPYDVVIRYRNYGWSKADSLADQNKRYCDALLDSLIKVRRLFQQAFLNYQIDLLKEPVVWLRSLEELIDENVDWFVLKGVEHLLPYWYQHIIGFLIQHQRKFITSTKTDQTKKSKLIHAKTFLESPFDIEKVKRYQRYLKPGIDRVEYLTRMEMNYLHHQHQYARIDRVPFNEQVRLELKHQDYEECFFQEQQEIARNEKTTLKFQINGSIKLLAIAFKSMIDHSGVNGQPFLMMTPEEAIDFLSDYTVKLNKDAIDKSILYRVFLNRNTVSFTTPRKNPLSHISQGQYYDFDINQIVKILSTIRSTDYRMLFLKRVRTNFLQHRLTKKTDFSFEKRINGEIAYQKRMDRLREKKYKVRSDGILQFHINGQLNVFMDVFYELKTEIGEDKKQSYLTNNKKELSRLLSIYFYDKNGMMLNPSSLYSYFKPSHVLKRCPPKKKIQFKAE